METHSSHASSFWPWRNQFYDPSIKSHCSSGVIGRPGLFALCYQLDRPSVARLLRAVSYSDLGAIRRLAPSGTSANPPTNRSERARTDVRLFGKFPQPFAMARLKNYCTYREQALHVVKKFLVTRYLWVVSGIWRRIPGRLRFLPLFLRYGTHLHSLVLRFVDRRQNHSTSFFRNRAELELIRRLTDQASHGSKVDIAVFACSKGAEVYSIAWALRTARPDMTINVRAIDVSPEVVEFAARGVYSLRNRDNTSDAAELSVDTYSDQPADFSPFKFMSESEKNAMFDRDGDVVSVKSWIKEGIAWHCADAGDPKLASTLNPQDMIIANRFLCHMNPAVAERILRNVSRVVKPGGYLFVSGVDLDVRMRVAMDLKWKPVTELMEEIHDGDPSIRDGWPFDYWAKEPLDVSRRDAMIRYASAFKIN